MKLSFYPDHKGILQSMRALLDEPREELGVGASQEASDTDGPRGSFRPVGTSHRDSRPTRAQPLAGPPASEEGF